jgi:NAD-reducing hydrogenase large subunit
MSAPAKRIIIEPVTRVEGHGKVSIYMDEENRVEQARLHIVEFRGFERFIQGRPYWEVPVLVQRLCGICPVSHHLCAAKAMDQIVGVDTLTPAAEKIRRLCHYGQTFQSHALHFFHLCSPDLLFGFDADPAIRNVIGVIREFPELAKQGVLMRKYGQEVIKACVGKKIHGTGAIPGGVNKPLSVAERDALLPDMDQMLEWAVATVKIAKDYTVEHLATLKDFASSPTNHVSIVREDGAMDLYHGNLRAVGPDGDVIFDGVKPSEYTDYFQEEVRDWSYMKFPFIKSLGNQDGWYRVGPLPRVNVCDFIDTPLAEKERKEFMALTDGKPNNITMAYHWTRMIELLHAMEKIKELLHDPDLQSDDLVIKGDRREEAVAILEAPRGSLFHHYKVNEQDEVVMANLIVSTTHNNSAMNEAVQRVAADHLDGKPELTEGMLNHVEVAIRAYDPCLSCATHAMGQMPLVVSLFDHEGNLVAKRVKQ